MQHFSPYTSEHIKMISQRMTDKNRVSLYLSYYCGLWPAELMSLKPLAEREPDVSLWYNYHKNVYTVIGKRNIVRDVLIPEPLCSMLELFRLDEPIVITDRMTSHSAKTYSTNYDIGFGSSLSASITQASKKHLGWNANIRGVIECYRDRRCRELFKDKSFSGYDMLVKRVSAETACDSFNIGDKLPIIGFSAEKVEIPNFIGNPTKTVKQNRFNLTINDEKNIFGAKSLKVV